MALLCVCLGLRIREALALRWGDVDWLGSTLSVQRGIVEQVVADVKTEGSARTFTSELLERLKSCKQRSDFSGAEDWILASPLKLGRLPYSYTGCGGNLCGPQRPQKSGTSGRTLSGTLIAHGLTLWAPPLRSNRR
jgi:integrase